MLGEVSVEVENEQPVAWNDWRAVDRALRSIAVRRAALDAEEARWLRAAEEIEVWRPLGMVSAIDYMERILGYAPHAANERLRVARMLGALPETERAWAGGRLNFSAVRELTRVATRATEGTWIDAVGNKSVREVEELVAGHRPGDLPTDPADPDLRMHVVRFELPPEVYAALREARLVLEEEHGRRLSDSELVAALAGVVLDGHSDGRARHQIALTVCSRCRQGWQEGAGAKIAVGPAVVERAECDAQHIGSIDGEAPERAYQDIPPALARLVWRRDFGRCRVPGCRSARGLDIHHIVRRADGGTHEASNLVLVCSSCHQAHHDGRITISGSAEQIDVQRPAGQSHVGLSEKSTTRSDARTALFGLGWKSPTAAAAVDAALAELGADPPLERVIYVALSKCWRVATS
jgi:hypothetical protein